MTDIEIYKEVSGEDEDRESKALIGIECKLFYPDETYKDIDEIQLDGPIVNISRSARFTMVDIYFSSATDYDFIQTVKMLSDFTKDYSLTEDSLPGIVLTLIPKGSDGGVYVSGVNAAWSLFSSLPNRFPDTVRLTFVNIDIDAFEINEEIEDYPK